MNFPKETIPGAKSFYATSDVYLEASHICIKKNVAEKIFGTETVVLSVFYEKDNTFMVAPAGEELFKTIHKANQQMLKMKNASGDRSISIQELFLDNDIEETNRNLEFEVQQKLHILKVKL
jgi:soluble P-type ATPase